MASALRLGFSFFIVFGLMWASARVMRRRGFGSPINTPPHAEIQILDRKGVGKSAAIAVVRVGSKDIIVGITDNQVSNLGETEPDLFAELEAEVTRTSQLANGPTWTTLLNNVREKTVRKS